MLTVYCKKIIIKLSNDKGMNIMNIAILYHVQEPPQVGNIRKPMKEGITKVINMGADVLWLKMHLEYIRQQKRRIIKSVKNLIKTVCL